MKSSPVKVFGSLFAVIALFAAAYLFVDIPSRVKAGEAAELPVEKIGSFHIRDRSGEIGELKSPHTQNPYKRGFLNMHARVLDCPVCHLEPAGASIGKLSDGRLALLAGGRAVSENDAGAVKRARPPQCADCHKRGSKILADNYFGQRLRVLEDLSVLTYLGGN